MDIISSTDFLNDENFVDDECFDNCYIYPLCPICYGANYFKCKTFKKRDKSKCRIQKLIALFAADLHARRFMKNPQLYDKAVVYDTIEAIKKIRGLYLKEFMPYLE